MKASQWTEAIDIVPCLLPIKARWIWGPHEVNDCNAKPWPSAKVDWHNPDNVASEPCIPFCSRKRSRSFRSEASCFACLYWRLVQIAELSPVTDQSIDCSPSNWLRKFTQSSRSTKNLFTDLREMYRSVSVRLWSAAFKRNSPYMSLLRLLFILLRNHVYSKMHELTPHSPVVRPHMSVISTGAIM